MRFNKKMAAVAAVITAAVGAASSAYAEKWDMPMAYSASNYHSVTGIEFAQCVTTGTGGGIEITVHPSGSLIKGADIKRAIQTGQVPIGERLLSGHQNENTLFGYDSVPFLATSFDDSDKLWKAAKPSIEGILDEQNLTLLYTVPWPPQGIYFDRDVNSVADMEGIKFRSYNNTTTRFAELTGMLPVVIEAAEISQAFATGVAESMISSGATGYDRKIWEVVSNFYEVNSWLPRNYIMVNTDVWNNTDGAHQNVVRGCASLAKYAGAWRAKEYTGFSVSQLAANGMKVQDASDQLKADFGRVGDEMSREWLEGAGAEGQVIIDAYKALR